MLERAFLLLALFGQQGAFFNVIRVYQGRDAADQVGTVTDPFNMASVAVTFSGLLFLLWRRPRIAVEIVRHAQLLIFICLFAAFSGVWSDSVGLTTKRAAVLLNSMLLALYIAVRLEFKDGLQLVGQAVAICAVSSLFFGLFVRKVGVMHSFGLEGRWRGVFPHKNPFAQAMAIGAVIELYGMESDRRWLPHLLFYLLEVGLVVLANSATVLIILAFSTAAYVTYALSRRGDLLTRLFWILTPLSLGAVVLSALIDPSLIHAVSGRDSSLTGRAQLWAGVRHAISLRPLLGYGYQAFWDGADPLAMEIWNEIGWPAPNAHNSALEVVLGLGVVGGTVVLALVLQAIYRTSVLFLVSLRGGPAASFRSQAFCATVLVIAILIESLSEAVLMRQGDIDWMMLNLVSMAAGLALVRTQRQVLPPPRSVAARARPLTPPSPEARVSGRAAG